MPGVIRAHLAVGRHEGRDAHAQAVQVRVQHLCRLDEHLGVLVAVHCGGDLGGPVQSEDVHGTSCHFDGDSLHGKAVTKQVAKPRVDFQVARA